MNHPDEARTLYNSPELASSYQNMSDAAVEAALKKEYVPLWQAERS